MHSVLTSGSRTPAVSSIPAAHIRLGERALRTPHFTLNGEAHVARAGEPVIVPAGARLEALVAIRERTARRVRWSCRSPKERAWMTCTESRAAVSGRGGPGLPKVPRVWSPAAAEEAVSIV